MQYYQNILLTQTFQVLYYGRIKKKLADYYARILFPIISWIERLL